MELIPVYQQKPIDLESIAPYSNKETDIRIYLNNPNNSEFNTRIYYDLTSRRFRLNLSQATLEFYDERRELFSEELDKKLFSPELINPLVFFNLLYNGFNYLIENSLDPLNTLTRIRSITLEPLQKIYFLQKLAQLVEEINIHFFYEQLIKDRITIFKSLPQPILGALKTKLDNSITHHEKIIANFSIDQKINYLINAKNSPTIIHNDLLLANEVLDIWLLPKLETLNEMKTYGLQSDFINSPKMPKNKEEDTIESNNSNVSSIESITSVENEKLKKIELLKNSIKTDLKLIKVNPFNNDEDKDEFITILAHFFLRIDFPKGKNYKLANRTKSKVASLFNKLHHNYSESKIALQKDYAYFEVIRSLNQFSNDTNEQIYKAITKINWEIE